MNKEFIEIPEKESYYMNYKVGDTIILKSPKYPCEGCKHAGKEGTIKSIWGHFADVEFDGEYGKVIMGGYNLENL